MIIAVYFVKIFDDARYRSVIVMIFIRSQPKHCEIAIAKQSQPFSLVRTEQLVVIKEFSFEEESIGLAERTHQYPRICRRNYRKSIIGHRPAVPIANLALEYFARCVQ